MYLKKLTISGFKSFADKVTLTFDRGITGIVGPNGSGKSNVIDSVRWLMGEQNARMLRAEKATDIIFAGSEKRAPLSMAEVTLVFDNTEDDEICPPEYRLEPEIAITRRLYADGEREYLINRKECRLKDIVQFLSLTGLGGRSYSMIQQGQVDRILNAKPEDVREILEEAAGTLLYKQRKVEAQKKLEETQINLSRVEDILKELEKQQSVLHSQVERAREWRDLSDELREKELAFLSHNYTFNKTKLEQTESSLSEKSAREAEILAQISTLEAREVELQEVLDRADPELTKLGDELSTIRESIARAEALIKNGEIQKEQGGKRLQDIAFELSEEGANLKALEGELKSLDELLLDLETQTAQVKAALESFNDDLSIYDERCRVLHSRIEDLQDEARSLERSRESNKLRRENYAKEIEKSLRNKSVNLERIAVLGNEIVVAEAGLSEVEVKLKSEQFGLDKEIREKHNQELALASYYNRIKEINQEKDARKERYHEVKARILSLEELVSAGSGATHSFSDLCEKDKAIRSQTRGMLTDYLRLKRESKEVPQSALSACEQWLERVVLDNVDNLNSLIRSMQRHQTGAIPVTVMSLVEPLSQDGVNTWMDRFDVLCLSDYFIYSQNAPKEIVDLTKRIFLIQALNLEETLICDIPKGAVAVTSQGTILSGPEFISVGSGLITGALSRKKEIEDLTRELKVYEEELASAQAEVDDLEFKIQETRASVTEIDSRLQNQNKDVLEILAEHQSIRQALTHKKELLDAARQVIEEIETLNKTMLAECEDLEKAFDSIDQEKIVLQREIQELESELASVTDEREERSKASRHKETELVRIETKLIGARDQRRHIVAQIELVQNKLLRRFEEQSNIKTEMEIFNSESISAKEEVEKLVLKRDLLHDQIMHRREANSAIHEELKAVESGLREVRELQTGIQKDVSQMRVEAERLKVNIESLRSQCFEKYHFELASYEFDFDENFEIDACSKIIQNLREKIDKIGAVNMMAMDEYDQLTVRQEFIVNQRNEINRSIEVLSQAIEEIETTSRKKFGEVFEKVNEEFGKLFPILFKGGEANLELTNADDPLVGGVEIMVRLPGKKTQRMNLFSGGEKALTAISLIFALLKTKPTPFCFLDEVDAPLDEANVGRYNRVLEALSEQFQFIVITHNRRTMEVLDTLYGVTMQEAGVSSVVGVDMKRDLPPHLKKAFKDNNILVDDAHNSRLARQGAASI